MSASKSNLLKWSSQSLVSALVSLLNIWQQDCPFSFFCCKVHVGPYRYLVAEMPSYDLFFYMEKFSKFGQLYHNLCRIKILSFQALFLLPTDIQGLFVWWKCIPSNKYLRITSTLLSNGGRTSSNQSFMARRSLQNDIFSSQCHWTLIKIPSGARLIAHPCETLSEITSYTEIEEPERALRVVFQPALLCYGTSSTPECL